MFTGIIKSIGKVVGLTSRGDGGRLELKAEGLIGLQPGDSLAVNGVCLTLTEVHLPRLEMDVLNETLSKTDLGGIRPGEAVNLEPALKAGEELGGHLVTGHVEGMGRLLSRKAQGEDWIYTVFLPPGLRKNVVMKGSIALEGISLTIAALTSDSFSVHLIPFTLDHTNLGAKREGDPLNIETDLLGKYVARQLESSSETSTRIDWEYLQETGFLK